VSELKADWETTDGRIRLFNRDCMEVLPLLGVVDCVVTDPPYGIGAAKMTMGRGSRNDTGHHKSMTWDSKPPRTEDLLRICEGRPSIVWGGNYFGLPASRCWLVWDKLDPNSDFAAAELAWTNLDRVAKTFYLSRKANSLQGGFHPTQKPLSLMLWCLSMIPESTVVFDPFMGSGTTGLACLRLGKRFIGIEKERPYFEAAIKRITDELNRTPLFDPAPIIQRSLIND
jgi:site-specific DNA-methyltransferase (adenine-specific)